MDLLSDVLNHLKLKGTLYFRTSFTSPWSVLVPAFEKVARFHYVHRGRCLVRVADGAKPVQLEQGDLIIIPHGSAHTMYCDPATETLAQQLDKVIEESGFTGSGTLVYGEPGSHHETQLVCGHFAFDDAMRHPLIDELPDYIHIRQYSDDAGQWLDNILKVIGAEAGQDKMGSELIALKLSEIIFAQALRTYLLSEPTLAPGRGGFADPRISKSIKAIHQNPGYSWTLNELASIAGLSRTAFATTFNKLMSTTPLGYITQWRMQIARELLLNTRAPIIDVAEQAGYQSEASFSRVFKKYFDQAPATFRRNKLQEIRN